MILEDFSNLNDFGILGLPQIPGNRNTSSHPKPVPDQFLILFRQLWQLPSFKISKLRGRDTMQLLRGIAQGQNRCQLGVFLQCCEAPRAQPPWGRVGEGNSDLVGVALGVVPPEEINHSVHTHGTAARHGGGNISLSLALLPAKPGWDISPAPVIRDGFAWRVWISTVHCGHSGLSFPPFQM